MRRPSVLPIIPAAVLVLAALSCRTEAPAPAEESPAPVRTAPVEIREIAKPVRTSGRLAAKKEMLLSFKTGGIVRTAAAVDGRTVEKNALLARLDPTEIEAQVRQARSALEKAERDRDRVHGLYEKKSATLEQYQNVLTAWEMARAGLQAAEFNLRHSEIRAPAAGRVLRRLVEENEMTGPGVPALLFAGAEAGWVMRVGVSDRDLVRIKTGDPARLRFDVHPDHVFAAEVSEIVEAADPLTGTYEVELRVDPGGRKLVSGFTAAVEILPAATRSYAVIPVEALVAAEGSRGEVFTIDPEGRRARKLSIEIAFLFDRFAAVNSGLEGVERVVTVGAHGLREGRNVTLVDGDGPAGT
jgi:RND family efflux transporter MFP subunit